MNPERALHLFDVLLTLLALLAPSIAVAIAPHPSQVTSPSLAALLRVLGRLSLLRHGPSPGTLHLPGAAQPAPRTSPPIPPAGALASDLYATFAAARPGRGAHLVAGDESARVPALQMTCAAEQDAWRAVAAHVRRVAGAALVLLLLGALGACVTPLDRARRDLAAAAQVAAAAQSRLKTWDAVHQQDLVRRSKTRTEAQEALRLYRARRALVMQAARDTEQVMDAAADELLLQDAPRAQGGAVSALRSAAALKDAVRKLQEGR